MQESASILPGTSLLKFAPARCTIILLSQILQVLKIDRKKDLVIVEGIKIATKHVKPVREGETGSIVNIA